MAKRITHDLTYDAPLADVAAMLADPAFRKQVCDHQRVLRSEVDITGSGAGMRVRVEQVQASRGIPPFAQKIVGEEIRIEQSEVWTALDHADLVIEIPGKPGEIQGTAVLRESDGTTTETVDLTVKVSIPLVGGKLEGLIADLLLKALRAENTVGRDYLSRG